MPIYTPPDNPTAFQTLVMSLHAVLDDVLAKEGRAAPELFFGNPFQTQFDAIPRVGWQHIGGHFVVGENFPTTPAAPVTVPPTPPLKVPQPNPIKLVGTRRMMALCGIWHYSAEQAEHVLDRLWLSARRGDKDLQRFQWLLGKYDFPTESQGPRINNGESILAVTLPIDLPVPAEYDGERPLVTVLGSDLNAGITTDLNADPDVTQWQFRRWS